MPCLYELGGRRRGAWSFGPIAYGPQMWLEVRGGGARGVKRAGSAALYLAPAPATV